MEAIPEPSRTRIKREYSDDPEYSENNSDSDKRKSRSGKSRKHSNNYSESNSQESKEDYDGIKKESSSSHRSSRSSKRSSEERERRRDEERETERREKSTPRSHVKEERYLEEDNLVIDNKSESRERERGSRERKDPRERKSQTPDDANHRVYSDSDHEKNEKEIEEYNDENKPYKFRERNREYNEREGSRDYWRNNNNNNNREFNSRGGYRKDIRGRSETGKSNPGFGNRNFENSDSIEIRPMRNLDFTRDSDFENNDDQRDRYNNRGGSMNPNPNQSGPNQNINNNSNNNLNSPLSNQFGGRGIRGGFGRGRLNNNNNNNNNNNSNNNNNINNNNPQRNIGVQNLQMPMMGPPFGPIGLPPGPLGPNMGPPPLFIPPFPPIWPGGRGMDINLIPNLPPNLPPIPPIQVPPRFNPNLTPIQIPQVSSNKNMATPSREMTPLDKPNNSIVVSNNNNNNMSNNAAWLANRNMPGGKAPSRGEQNDYSQNFVDTGMRPQNFIRELELSSVVEDYPKLRELIQRKDEIVANAASAPMYYSCDLKEHVLSPEFFGTKFDVILVDPPWEEYVHRAPGITDHIEYWTMEEIMNLKLEAIADTPSFIFLWVGDGVGLEQGRQCLKKWGFRRCEDICWVKTNKKSAGPGLRHDSHTLFQHSKEHCLMGIKGTVRRSTDGHIIHANIDTDIIIAEEPSDGSTKKPEDMYRIIEHFALGKRRLELFGEDHNIRPGWLTVGKGLSSSNFNKEAYIRNFADKDGKVWLGGGGRNPPPEAPHLVITTPEIESLRPKSPPQKGQNQNPLPPLGGGNNSISRRNSGSSNQDLISIIGNGNNGGGNGMFELGDGSGSNSGMFIDAFGFPNLL